MRIKVLYDFENVGSVNVVDLQRLIEEGKIISFQRSDGWVRIGVDPIRGVGGDYNGPERRNVLQRHSPAPKSGMHVCILPKKKSG